MICSGWTRFEKRAVGLDDDEVFGNFMKNPELAIESEILVTGLGVMKMVV
jgi:hypothetical protein